MLSALTGRLYKWLERSAQTRLDEFSSLQRDGRDAYKYIEGDHQVSVQVEMLMGVPNVVIYSRTIDRWLPPHDNEVIGTEKKRIILNKICKFLEQRHISYRVG